MATRVQPTNFVHGRTIEIPRDHVIDCDKTFRVAAEIREKYKTWNDPLSKDLHRWGELIKLENIPEKDLLKEAVSLIGKLRNEILVNPLDFAGKASLLNPVLEREWTWEKSWLEAWPSENGMAISPFDDQPMTISMAKPHAFVIEMLNLVESLKFNAYVIPEQDEQMAPPSSELTNTVPIFDDYTVQLICFLCKKAAKTYATIAVVRNTRDTIVKMEEIAERVRKQTEQACAEKRKNLQEEMNNHEKKFGKSLDNMQSNHEAEIKVMDGEIRSLNAKTTALKVENEKVQEKANSLEAANQNNQRTIASLQAQLNSIPRGGGGGGCIIL